MECLEDGLLVLQPGLLPEGPRLAVLSGREGRPGKAGRWRPRRRTKDREPGAVKAESSWLAPPKSAVKPIFGRKSPIVHAHLRVGGTEQLLGLEDVGPPLQQGGGQAGGNGGREGLIAQGARRAGWSRKPGRAEL